MRVPAAGGELPADADGAQLPALPTHPALRQGLHTQLPGDHSTLEFIKIHCIGSDPFFRGVAN